MTFLTPLGLLAGLSLPILIAFYLLKVRRTDQEVASTFLWEQLRRDLAAHEPWQRLRLTALLFLQAAILVALVLALARPIEQYLVPRSYFTAIVVDTSASMAATDVAPSRLARARADARRVIDSLPTSATAAIIEAGAHASVVVPETGNRSQLVAGLDRLQPSAAVGTVGPALRLAGALSRGRPGSVLELFSDGAYRHSHAWDDLPLKTVFHQEGTSTGNRAITEFSARPDPTDAGIVQLFARIGNFDSVPQVIHLVLTADGAKVESRQLALAANSSGDIVFSSVPNGAHLFQLHIVEQDALASDNTASLVRAPSPPLQILLVSDGNLFLQKALPLLPNGRVFTIAPRAYSSLAIDRFDVVIFDGFLPENLPAKNLLIINPPDSPFFPYQRMLTSPPVTLWRSTDPVLQYVDLNGVWIARAPSVTIPSWAHALIESNGVPLAFAGDLNGHQVVGITFDLQQSNLPLTTAFPVLIANAIHALQPPTIAGIGSYTPGSPVTIIPTLGVDHIVISNPQGQTTTIATNGQPFTDMTTDQTGVYQVVQSVSGRVVSSSQFAINLTDPAESDLRPRAVLSDRANAATALPSGPRPVTNEFWSWLLLAGAGLFAGEWWWYHRRA